MKNTLFKNLSPVLAALAIILLFIIIFLFVVGARIPFRQSVSSLPEPSPSQNVIAVLPTAVESLTNGRGIADQNGIFKIPELNLQMKVTDDIRDLTYWIVDYGSSYGNEKDVRFITDSLQNASDSITSNCTIGGFGLSSEPFTSEPYNVPEDTWKVGQMYVYYYAPQEGCDTDLSDPDFKKVATLQKEQTNSLHGAIKTLEVGK